MVHMTERNKRQKELENSQAKFYVTI